MNWPVRSFLILVFYGVSGLCLGTHYKEHGFEFHRWLLDVASAGAMPAVFFGIAIAVDSLAIAAVALFACLVAAMVLFIYWTAALTWFVMGPGIPVALLSFIGGRLFRDSPAQAWQFSLRTLLLLPLVVAAAAWLVWLRAIPLLAAVALAVAATGAALAACRLTMRQSSTQARRWTASLQATAACLYLPFSWLLLIDYPWNGYHLMWLAISPALPGGVFVVLLSFTGRHAADVLSLIIAGLGALVLLALFTWIAQRGRWSTILALLAALATAGYIAIGAHAIFRA